MSVFRLSVLAAATALSGAAAQAATCPATPAVGTACYDVTATVTADNSGTYLGDTGTGTLIFDTVALAAAGGNTSFLASGSRFDFVFDIFGQTFTDADDTDSSLTFESSVPTNWSLVVSESFGSSPTAIDDPFINGFFSEFVFTGGNLTLTDPETVAVNLSVDDTAPPPAIPLPASVWLLGGGLLGLGVWTRRRRQDRPSSV